MKSSFRLVFPSVWDIKKSPWGWCLFSQVLEVVNNLRYERGCRASTANTLWKDFFDLSTDIKGGYRRLKWTIDGVVFKYAVQFADTPDIPTCLEFYVPSGWCTRVIEAVTRDGYRAEDCTPHPNGKFPKKRIVNVYTATSTFRLKD